jgi:Sec-independent protein translocase protein TatA
MDWYMLQLVAAAAILVIWEEKLMVVGKEVKAISKLFKVTDEKGKELIRTVKESMKKVQIPHKRVLHTNKKQKISSAISTMSEGLAT